MHSENPRDAFIRTAMGMKEISVPLLKMCLDEELKGQLDLEGAELMTDTFIHDEGLRKSVSELIFRVPDSDSAEATYIYLLMVPNSDGLEAFTPTVEKCRHEAMAFYGDPTAGTCPLVVPIVVSLGNKPPGSFF